MRQSCVSCCMLWEGERHLDKCACAFNDPLLSTHTHTRDYNSIRLHKHRVGPSPNHVERPAGRITPSGRYVPGGRFTPSGRFTPTGRYTGGEVGRQRSFFSGMGLEGSLHGAPQLDPVYVGWRCLP